MHIIAGNKKKIKSTGEKTRKKLQYIPLETKTVFFQDGKT